MQIDEISSFLDIMKKIPETIDHIFCQRMKSAGICYEIQQEYRKWLRFYLDFCDKYYISASLLPNSIGRKYPGFAVQEKDQKVASSARLDGNTSWGGCSSVKCMTLRLESPGVIRPALIKEFIT